MNDRRFGISTRLFQQSRLCREHLVHIAAHGFETVEVVAERSHFDYRDPRAVDELSEWLSDTRLELQSLHAPASQPAAEIDAVIAVASSVPYRYLVMHPGLPVTNTLLPGIVERAAQLRVTIALEVIPSPPAPAASLVRLIEDELDGIDLGICLDYGHAHLMGDLGEAIEAVSGHMVTTHLHDNGGARDEHLVPFAGGIDWDAAMMETQKIGYDGVLMFELAGAGSPVDVLKRTAHARARLEKTLVTF
ncbi:MAG: TIM barrel protein [Vicinamibacterales bacterium]